MTGSLRTNLCLRAIRAVLDAKGIPFEVSHGGKHPRVTFSVDGQRVRYPFPASTGDRRSHLAASTQVKRIIRTRKSNHEE